MDAKIAEEMKEILLQIASEKGIIVHKMVIDEDHVHMFISIRPWMSVSLALQYLKGISSYKISGCILNSEKNYSEKEVSGAQDIFQGVSAM